MVTKGKAKKPKVTKSKPKKVKPPAISRIFVTGCPRSGTTLMSLLLAWGDEKWKRLAGEEVPKRKAKVIGKRPSDDGVAQVEELLKKDSKLFVIWMVRDPRDTCVSVHPLNPEKGPTVTPAMWLERAKKAFELTYNNSRVVIVRYEDMVTKPREVQVRLSIIASLKTDRNWGDWKGEGIDENTKEEGEYKNVKALRGIRAVEKSRIGVYKETPSGLKLALKLAANPEVLKMANDMGYDLGKA